MGRLFKEFEHKRYAVEPAKMFDVIKYVLTRGRKGSLYEIVDITKAPPSHDNCKCSTNLRGYKND